MKTLVRGVILTVLVVTFSTRSNQRGNGKKDTWQNFSRFYTPWWWPTSKLLCFSLTWAYTHWGTPTHNISSVKLSQRRYLSKWDQISYFFYDDILSLFFFSFLVFAPDIYKGSGELWRAIVFFYISKVLL